ncbi:MAG: hypothetical protein ABI898_04525 [Sphingomonadales bacterium]
MEIAYLRGREKTSLIEAKNARCLEARVAHEEFAQYYGARVLQILSPLAVPVRSNAEKCSDGQALLSA